MGEQQQWKESPNFFLHIKENRLENTFVDNTKVNALIIFCEFSVETENKVSNQSINKKGNKWTENVQKTNRTW